jgi:dUTP pyrophosphatase
MLLLVERSSQGFKYNIRMCNQVGVIDKDYYNNPKNEGHIYIKLFNEGDNDYKVKKGEKIVQGLFVNFLTVDNEDEINSERTGWTYLDNKGKK